MRASDPPGRNNSARTYRFRGEGSKSGRSDARFHNGGQSRQEETWRSRKEQVRSHVYPTAEGVDPLQGSVAEGVCNDHTLKDGVGDFQGAAAEEGSHNGDKNMQVESLVCHNNMDNSVELHASIVNVVREVGNSSLDTAPFLEFVIACSCQLVVSEFEALCTTWWRIWHRRNMAFHNNLLMPASDILSWVRNFVADFKSSNERVEAMSKEVVS
ncbi:hypothetical protein Q3G72_001370 [Acer saccharum]|nr:hypothetical protein Q3G72_001370 [Acer saccharum]